MSNDINKASRSNDGEQIRRLIKTGTDIEKRTHQEDTPLISAAKFNNPKVVKILLEHGSDPTVSNIHGNTAMTFAIYHSNVEIALCLLEHGVDINDIFKNYSQRRKDSQFFTDGKLLEAIEKRKKTLTKENKVIWNSIRIRGLFR